MKRYERDDHKVLYHALDNGRTLIVQPHGSPICGQCSMAMIAGVKVQEIVDQLYCDDGTTYPQRDAVLSHYMDNVRTVGHIDNRKAIDLSGVGIVAMQYGRSNSGHAVAFENGEIYDPAGRHYESLAELKKDYKSRGRKIRVHAVTYAQPRKVEAELMAASDTTL